VHGLEFDISPFEMYGITEELAKLTEKGVPASDIEKVCRKVIESHVKDIAIL